MAALPEYDSEYIQMDLFTFCSTAEEERVKFWRVRNSLQPSTVFHGVKTGVMGILQAGKAQAIKAAKGLAKKGMFMEFKQGKLHVTYFFVKVNLFC